MTNPRVASTLPQLGRDPFPIRIRGRHLFDKSSDAGREVGLTLG